MRYPVPSYCQDHKGNFYSANGISAVKKWNGYASDSVLAAVPAPSTAPTVGGSGDGQIAGVRYAYLRYLDADGNPGNVSPLSDPYTPASSTQTITNATNATPIVITTSAAHGWTTGDVIHVQDVNGAYTANGTWAVTVLTTTTAELDGSQGIGDYTDGGTAYQGVDTLTYSGLSAVTDTRVSKRQILRNKDGVTNVFYVDIETTDLSSTSLSSTNLDDDLIEAVTLVDSAGNDLYLSARSEPPDYKRYMAFHQGRIFMVGDVNYTEGAARIVNGSTLVFGVGHTGWTSSMVGWNFYPRNTSNTKIYTVTAVNTATQMLTLDTAYTGGTDQFARYALRPDDSERLTIYFSGVDQPEAFDLDAGLTMPDDKDAGEITGLMAYSTQLHVLFEHSVYRISYQESPDGDGFIAKSASRGCVNNNCYVVVDDTAFLLDRKGFWAFYGNDQEAIGDTVQSLFNQADLPQINFQRSEHFHAAHDRLNEVVRWFVCLEGCRYPKHAVCYNYRHKRWWIEEYTNSIGASTLGLLDGVSQVYLGTQCQTLAAGHIANDGGRPENGTLTGTVTSSNAISIVDSTASFSSNFVKLPLRIVSGTGKGQRRIISAASSTRLTVVQPWVIRPDTTSVYQVGGFEGLYRTGRYRYVQTGQQEKRGIEIGYEPIETGYMAFRKYEDRSETPVDSGWTRDADGISSTSGEPEYVVDLTKESGFIAKYDDGFLEYRVDGKRYAMLELEACPDEERIVVSEMSLMGLKIRGE